MSNNLSIPPFGEPTATFESQQLMSTSGPANTKQKIPDETAKKVAKVETFNINSLTETLSENLMKALPNEIIKGIFFFLNIQDQGRVAQVNKLFKKCSDST